MAYDPNLPANHAPVVSQELRNQFAGLKALIDAQQAQTNALQNTVGIRAFMPQMGEFDPGFHDPPTIDDLEAIRGFINQLVQELQNSQQ